MIPLDLKEALIALKELGLEDFIYDVREREGQGWDGALVKKFSDACSVIDWYVKESK